MPRLRNRTTGVVVRVADGHPATTSIEWEPAEAAPRQKSKPARARI